MAQVILYSNDHDDEEGVVYSDGDSRPTTPAVVDDVVNECTTIPDTAVQWQNRRRMAFVALASIVILTGYIVGPWVSIDRLNALSDVISWFYFTMVSIVGAYMGFKSWSMKTTGGQ